VSPNHVSDRLLKSRYWYPLRFTICVHILSYTYMQCTYNVHRLQQDQIEKTPTTSARGHTRRQWRDVDHIIIIIIIIIYVSAGRRSVSLVRKGCGARVYFRSIGIIRSARAYIYALFTRALSALRDAAVISVSRGGGWGFPSSHARRSVYNMCTRV